jgi:hypothetical protein
LHHGGIETRGFREHGQLIAFEGSAGEYVEMEITEGEHACSFGDDGGSGVHHEETELTRTNEGILVRILPI